MKTRKSYRLDDETINYVLAVKDEYNLTETAALEKIITDHKNKDDVKATQMLIDGIAQAVTEKLKNTLTRIRLGSNNADKNSEILLLMINQLLLDNAVKVYSEKQSAQFIESKRIVEERIQKFKTQKAYKKNSKSIPTTTTEQIKTNDTKEQTVEYVNIDAIVADEFII